MVDETEPQAGLPHPDPRAITAPNHPSTKEPEAQLPRTYLLGLAALGGGIGLFVGLSRTPVVGDLLPLLFALIATGGGIYVAHSGGSPERLHNLGRSLLAFVPACAAFALLGALTRAATAGCLMFLGYSLCAGAPALDTVPQIVDETLRLELRAYLQVFGASAAEQEAIVAAYFRVADDAKLADSVRARVVLLQQAADKLRQALAAPAPDNAEGGFRGPAIERASQLSLLLQDLLAVLNPKGRLRTIPSLSRYVEAVAKFEGPPPDFVQMTPGLALLLQEFEIQRLALLAALAAVPEAALAHLSQRAQQAKNSWPAGFKAEPPESTGVALEVRKGVQK